MDRRERINDPVTSLQAALQGWQAGMWTALPGIVQSFDPARVTAVVQPAIQAQVRDTKGIWKSVNLPLLLDCPVLFPRGGSFMLTMPVVEGDEGLVVFSSRCIDAVWQSGGVQPQAELRMHDLSDGFFLPGGYSQPRKPGAPVSTTAAQLRTLDGGTLIELTDGAIRIVGDVAVDGNITATGGITAGVGGADEVGLQTHKHGGGPPPDPGT